MAITSTRGEIGIVLLILMAIKSTGLAEVIAVVSILVYDIYQLYLKVMVQRKMCIFHVKLVFCTC